MFFSGETCGFFCVFCGETCGEFLVFFFVLRPVEFFCVFFWRELWRIFCVFFCGETCGDFFVFFLW